MTVKTKMRCQKCNRKNANLYILNNYTIGGWEMELQLCDDCEVELEKMIERFLEGEVK